jgi:hypothetical protein
MSARRDGLFPFHQAEQQEAVRDCGAKMRAWLARRSRVYRADVRPPIAPIRLRSAWVPAGPEVMKTRSLAHAICDPPVSAGAGRPARHRVRLDQCDQRYSSDQFGVDGSLGPAASLNNHSHAAANHHDRPSV